MRTTQKVMLHIVLLALFSGVCFQMEAQNTLRFQYGENDEFEGSLTAYLVMIGIEKTTGKRTIQKLRSSDFEIDYARYKDINLVLRIASFEFAKEDHYKKCWLELPLKEYINQDLPGLHQESKTKVLMLGGEEVPRARKSGDIRYSIDPSLDQEVEGTFRFSFDFISSDFPWKKIEFEPAMKYAIRSALPIEKSVSDRVPPPMEDPASEPPVEVEKKSEIVEVLPEKEAKKTLEEEKALLKAIAKTRNKDKVLSLCEEYRKKYPESQNMDDVIYYQVMATDDPSSRTLFLEEYVELFPDGDHILQINEMIFSSFTEKENLKEASPKEIVETPGAPLSADIKMKDGILTVSDIKGGESPFRLEFFEDNSTMEKKYAIDIGKNRSFKINLKTLPLEKSTYIIGLVDTNGTAPYYSAPLNVTDPEKLFKVEVPFISMVLGVSILAISLFFLIISRVFFKKRKRRRHRYTSKSYR